MVPAGKRKNGELSASTKSKSLLKYILQMSNSEKTFPKRARWNTIDPMCKIAWRIFHDISLANGVLVQSEEDAEERIKLQKDATKYLMTLAESADVIYEAYNVPTQKLEALTALITDTQEAVRKWMYGDKRSYRDKFPASKSPYFTK